MANQQQPTPAEHELSRKVIQASSAIARMEGDTGEFSYTRNSTIQAHAPDILKSILKQEISALLDSDDWQGTVRIADFGCSVGINSLRYAELFFQIVQECCRAWSNDEREAPDVQYFFSDLPSNDFNILFQQLEWRSLRTDPGVVDDGERKKLYAAAVPGSFYERLFPTGSLHVTISTYGLMWMWKVPDAVRGKASPAYYKGRVSIAGIEHSAALEAFAQCAKQDLNFLLSRAEEIKLLADPEAFGRFMKTS